MEKKPQTWSLIIFAYNEEKSIKNVVETALIVLEKLTCNKKEIIIVNDGSNDNTLYEINKIKDNYPEIIVINHPKNFGIGQSLISGYNLAKYENICAIPADGQFDMNELLPFSFIEENTIVSFFRKKKIRYSLLRKCISSGNKIFNRYFLGIKIKDVNWVKIYKKPLLDKIPKILTSSLVESEICAKVYINNYNIIEAESKYMPRIEGKSKGVSAFIFFSAVKEMIKLVMEIKKYKKNLKHI